MTGPNLSEVPGVELDGTDSRSHLDPAALRHADSLKWTLYDEGVIPMWIADMDYPVAPAILAALQDRLTRGLGYPQLMGDPVLTRLIQEKAATQGLTDLPAEGVALLPGVVPGIFAAVHALTAPGDGVLTMLPVYHPFHLSINDQRRVVQAAALKDSGTRWEIDWEALEAAVTPSTRLMLLCHPHNPTGRVWDAEELGKLRDFALRHNLYVCSDELHADLSYAGAPFQSFAADPRVRGRTVTLTGPCKAFNTAGLGIGAMLSHDAALIKRLKTAVGGLMGHPSALSITMWQAALQGGGPWLAETVDYLRGNRDFLQDFLARRLPSVKSYPVESTYLAWLDVRAHPLAGDIQQVLLERARVAIHNGPVFAPDPQKAEYQGFIRVNFATSRALLAEALERMAEVLGGDVE
ncbi:MalY/PatB family protein [Deinococcus oregonensis]|uniref:cysteine-S-conjugate beta-lyase n=1 Tax=Deinococcus oregonensis TaxID=1805970 RepID=A0ABV6AZ19_9DEIO